RRRADKSELHYMCQCDCGKRKSVNGNSLRRGKSKSCGCSQYKRGPSPKRHPGGAQRLMYSRYRSTAKKRGRDFAITWEQFRAVTASPCYYCGVERGHTYEPDHVSGPF